MRQLRPILCSLLLLMGVSTVKAQVTIFTENWTSPTTFATQGWTFDPAQGNWAIGANYTPTGATSPNAYFNWSPSVTNYSVSLVSPVISATGYVNMMLDYKLALNDYGGSLEQFKIEYKKTWQTSWTLLTNYSNVSGSFNVAPTNQLLVGTDTADIQIRFTAYGVNSFNINGWGLDDIVVKGTNATACNGVPNAGTTVSSSYGVCSGAYYTLSLSGATQASGLTYQWEESSIGSGIFTQIPNATNSVYTDTMFGSMVYQCIVTCPLSGGATATSIADTVFQNAFNLCYCSPLTGVTLHGFSSNYIDSVSIVGTTLANPSTTSGGGGYTFYPSNVLTQTASLNQGIQYTIAVKCPYTGYYNGVWIDWDANGTYDASEFIAMSGSGNLATGTFIVPYTAVAGLTGLRVRVNYNSWTSGQPCANMGYETEEYNVTIVAALPCSGTPNTPTITAPSTVCANSPFSLVATGYSTGLGITYQWQVYNTITSAWDSIGNQPSLVYPGQATVSDYRFVTTCANGGATTNSTTSTVQLSPFNLCYCSPNTGVTLHSGFSSNYIDSVSIVGTTMANTSTTSGAGGYTFYPSNVLTQTASLNQGIQYTIAVKCPYTGYYNGVWIDWDANGVYDASEFVATTVSGNLATGTFIVPYTAPAGATGLRVRVNYNPWTSGQACNDMGYETEEYNVTIVAAPPCSGTPNTPTVTAPGSVCANAPFTMSATGYSTGVGISYQWQVYNTVTSAWDSIGNQPSLVYPGQAAVSDYRFVTTCANGGGTSNSTTSTVSMNPFYTCYCSPLTGVTLHSGFSSNYIDSVSIVGSTLAKASTTSGAGGYTFYSPSVANQTTNLDQGLQYTLFVHCPYTGYFDGVWIDWDGSGAYDASEFVTMTTVGNSATGTFTVPYTSTVGLTGLRVRANYSTWASGQPCSDLGYETEEYNVNIILATGCNGTPSTPIAAAPDSICATMPIAFSATGFTTGQGITFQWQVYNTVTSAWDSIGNQPNFTYTVGQTVASDYRLVTTCANGGATSTSNTLTIAMNPPMGCYCTPGTTNSGASDNILNVTFAGINNTTTTGGTNGYVDYTSTVAPASVSQGLSYNASMIINNGGTENGGIWIDWDQNGVFDASEFTSMGSGATPTVLSQSISVPVTAILGTTHMRVRSRYSTALTGADPCIGYNYGETEDYLVTVTAAPTCVPSGTPSVSGTTFNATTAQWSQSSSNPSLGYDWRVVAQGAGVNGTIVTSGSEPAGDTVANVTGLTPTTNYTFYVRAVCSVGDSSAWKSVNFATACSTAVAPLAMSFDVAGTPNCWTNTTTPESWLFSTGSGPGYGVAGSTDHTGNGGYFAWVDGSGTGTNQGITLTSVPVDISTFATPNLSFYMKSYNSNDGALNKLIVQGLNGSNWVNLDSIQMNYPSAAWYNRQVSLTGLLSSVTQIRFRVDESNNVGGSSFYNDILVDDIQIVNGPLAIKMGALSATNVGSRNRVDWNTLSEDAGDRFVLERSADGRTYTELTTIEGKGKANTYSYWDHSPVQGVNYYRLKLLSVGNTATYSSVAVATVKGNGTFAVEAYPNPVSNQLSVDVYGAQGNNPVVTITDVTGKVVLTQHLNGKSAKVNMTGIAPGFYLVKYTDSNHSETIKITKQ